MKPIPKEQVSKALLGRNYTLSVSRVQKGLLRGELLEAQSEKKKQCVFKLLKDVPKQLVSVMLSAVLKQRVSS
jgi:hypothetical protein